MKMGKEKAWIKRKRKTWRGEKKKCKYKERERHEEGNIKEKQKLRYQEKELVNEKVRKILLEKRILKGETQRNEVWGLKEQCHEIFYLFGLKYSTWAPIEQ